MFFFLRSPIYGKYGTGTTVFSALAGGLLTGKVYRPTFHCTAIYINIKYSCNSTTTESLKDLATRPNLSSRTLSNRFSKKRDRTKFARSASSPSLLRTVRQLDRFTHPVYDDLSSFNTEFNASVGALALAWVAKNPNTSTIILGASKPQQVVDNLKALEILPKLTPEHMTKIEKILANKPKPVVRLFFCSPFFFSETV